MGKRIVNLTSENILAKLTYRKYSVKTNALYLKSKILMIIL